MHGSTCILIVANYPLSRKLNKGTIGTTLDHNFYMGEKKKSNQVTIVGLFWIIYVGAIASGKATDINHPGVGSCLFCSTMGTHGTRHQAVTGGSWSSTWTSSGDCKDGSTTQSYR